VYFQDESRFGLMTVLRRAITLAGVKPVGTYQHRFIYCYSLVEPLAGDHFFVTAPQVNSLYFEYMLQEFSRHEPQVFKIVFLDKAGYHKAKELNVPQNIRLVFLPSSNPQLNAVERLWGDMKANWIRLDPKLFTTSKMNKNLKSGLTPPVRLIKISK
jgi:transposase